MALSIVVRLPNGRYDAGALDPANPEWPPHPARLFCALVESAVDAADRDALRWLEMLPPPQVWASTDVSVSRTKGYVVINAVKGNASQTWPGRTNGLKQRASVLLADGSFAFVWPEADPDDLILARLVRLASRIPYIGRSTSIAEVSVLAETVAERPTWTLYAPVPLGTPGAVSLRVPFGGYLAALDDAYESGLRAWHVAARTVEYASGSDEPEPTDAVDGPYRDLLIWGFKRPTVAIGGDDLLTVTQSLRRAVLSRIGDGAPAEASGHGADGIPHLAYLALINVGNDNADGHLLGLAVGIPHHLTSDQRRAVLRALLGQGATDPMTRLRGARGRQLHLEYRPEAPWGVRPARWVAPSGSRAWVTATPLMLDRYVKREDDLANSVARSVVTAGFPEPASVEILAGPAVKGGVHRYRPGTLPDWARRPLLHCRVTFHRPQRGPVLAGALRYFGGGLFVPEVSSADG